MLNSFLSHFLFGTTNSNNEDTLNTTNTNVNNVNINDKSAILIDADDNCGGGGGGGCGDNIKSMKFNFIDDYRHDIGWVIVDPYDSAETKKSCDKKRKLNLTRSLTMSEYGLSNLFDEEQLVPQQQQSIGCRTTTTTTTASVVINNQVEQESDDGGDDSGRSTPTQEMQIQDSYEKNQQLAPAPITATTETKQETVEQKLTKLATTNTCEKQSTKEDNWCITPLPSLVKISNAQRSLIESGPFENLLIEHPSMSVFISATSSNNNDDKDDSNNENDCLIVDDRLLLLKQQQKRNKRQRKQKKNKRSNGGSAAAAAAAVTALANNKENEGGNNRTRQNSTSTTVNGLTTARLLCNTLANASKQHINKLTANNKKQMKRNNKLQLKNANIKQRKYHNLQQPQYMNNNFNIIH